MNALYKNILSLLFLFSFSNIVEAYPDFSTFPIKSKSSYDQYECYNPSPLEIITEAPQLEPSIDLSNFLNLEKFAQDFVLESKQIYIKEYPTAFNPSIIRWKGALLMSFRIRDKLHRVTGEIGLISLDEEFNPKGSPYILDVYLSPLVIPSKIQDPRLIVINDEIYMVYCNAIVGEISPEVKRVFWTKIHFDGIHFSTEPQVGIFVFPGISEQRWEKNWSPFEYNNQLLLTNSLSPHRIMNPLSETESSDIFSISDKKINWKWGQLRGGTQAYLIDDEYLSFFHSSISKKTVHSKGKEMPHYVMGAYTFKKDPPFEITKISKDPIVGKEFYSGPPYNTWKPLRVVFPGGFVYDESFLWVVFGIQDHELWVVKLDKATLLNSLIPCKP